MPSSSPSLDDDSIMQSSDQCQNHKQYPTLKQSLSASLTNGLRNATRQLEDHSDVGKGRPQRPQTTTNSSSVAGNASKPNSPAETALSALRFLPVPLLVLSSMKTVVLANDAMGRLFGLTGYSSEGLDEQEEDASAGNPFLGKTVNQLGVDIVQDGQRIWVGWERFLDNLAQEVNRDTRDQSNVQKGDSVPKQDEAKLSAGPSDSRMGVGSATPLASRSRKRNRGPLADTVVDVVLSAEFDSAPAVYSTMAQKQVNARLVISIWTLNGEKHFTLSFTNVSHSSTPTTDADSRSLSRTPPSASQSPSSGASSASSNVSQDSSNGASRVEFPSGKLLTLITFSPLGTFNKEEGVGTPSVLHKTTKMKDAILNSMEIPVCAMWKDQSLAFPNKAAMRVIQTATGHVTEDAYNVLSGFKCWTEDFSRELNEDEYPLVELCRTQKPFKSQRIGFKDPTKGNTVYDCSGECYYDEKTGEFLAGMIALKDVTEYTSLLKSQSEVNEQQFELICHTTPNMVSWLPPLIIVISLTYLASSCGPRIRLVGEVCQCLS